MLKDVHNNGASMYISRNIQSPRQHGICICKNKYGLHPYHVQKRQQLLPEDKAVSFGVRHMAAATSE